MQRLFLTLALLGIPGALASQVQQGTVTVADPIALDGRIQLDGGKHFKGMTKILVPTAIIRIATRGSLTVVNQGRFFDSDSRTAKAKGRFVVAGLDKEFIQGLARQAHDDFVARLRTTGYTVLTYDDVKDSPEVAGMKRYKPDGDYGVPTGDVVGSKNTYLMAFPSDGQAIDPPMQGYAWGFRKVAKELDATIIVPEYVVDAPLLTGAKKHGASSRGATVSVFPEMLVSAYVPFNTSKGAWGSLRTKGPIGDVADDVGTMGEARDDSPKFANALSAGLAELSSLGADLQAKSGTWGMKVNRPAYTAGVLRGIGSFNMEAARIIAAEKAK